MDRRIQNWVIFGRNSRNHAWREDGHAFKPKNTIPTVKFGGGIRVWGCFSANGTGNISVIDGRMNAAAYQNILVANFMISVENLELNLDGIFKKDNVPKHPAKSTKNGYMKIM